MATIRIFPVAATVAGTPRISPQVDYDGTSNQTVLLQLVCPTWASADPAQNITLSVEQSFDSGVSWAPFCIMVTQGARVGRTGNLPYVNCQCVDGRGLRKVRAVLSVDSGSINLGVDATT
jgi:hypothetical protein